MISQLTKTTTPMDLEAEEVLALFDLYWFRHQILLNRLPSPPSPSIDAVKTTTPAPAQLPPSPEPITVNHSKLNTILSGKEGIIETEVGGSEGGSSGGSDGEIRRATGRRRQRDRRRRGRMSGGGGGSKSLSELEFEELRGLMDLGFNFSDTEPDPRLMSIVPGLQRLRKAESPPAAPDGVADVAEVRRPYLSEAWAAAEEEAERNLLMGWRIPAAEDGVDLKDHLRLWAHTVASTVR